MAGCPSRRPSRSASQPQRPHFGFLALAACILGTQGERLYSAVDGETDGAGESGARAAPRAGRQVHHPQLSRGAAFRASFPPELARHVLDFVPFRYRLATHCGPSNATIWGPSRPRLQLSVEQGVVGVEFFPLGDMALTWDGAGRAVVWDAASGELLRELAGRVQAACVLPDGRRVATCSTAGACTVWRVASGEAEAHLPAQGTESGLRVSAFPSGDRLLTWGGGNAATVWSASLGRSVCASRGESPDHSLAVIFPDGGRVVTGSRRADAVTIRDAATCSPVLELEFQGLRDVAVLKGGALLAALDFSGSVSVWETASGKLVNSFRDVTPLEMAMGVLAFGLAPSHISWAQSLHAFHGRAYVAIVGPIHAVIWDAETGETVGRISPQVRINGFAVSPGSDAIAMCDRDWVLVKDAVTGALLATLRRTGVGAPLVDCGVAFGVGAALDPEGFGRGVSWRQPLWGPFA